MRFPSSLCLFLSGTHCVGETGLGDLEILNPQNTSLYDVQVDVFIRSSPFSIVPSLRLNQSAR